MCHSPPDELPDELGRFMGLDMGPKAIGLLGDPHYGIGVGPDLVTKKNE